MILLKPAAENRRWRPRKRPRFRLHSQRWRAGRTASGLCPLAEKTQAAFFQVRWLYNQISRGTLRRGRPSGL